MIMIICVLAVLGYKDAKDTVNGVADSRRLATFNALTSDISSDLYHSGYLLFRYMDWNKPELIAESRKEIESALAGIKKAEGLADENSERTTLSDLRTKAQQVSELEAKVLDLMTKAAEQYANVVRVEQTALSDKLLGIAKIAQEINNAAEAYQVTAVLHRLGPVRGGMGRFAQTRSPEDAKTVEGYLANMEKELLTIEPMLVSDSGKKAYADIMLSYSRLKTAFETMRSMFADVNKNLDTLVGLLDTLTSSADTLSAAVDKESNKISADVQADSVAAQQQMIILGIAGLVAGLVIAIFIVMGIIRVLNELGRFAGAVAQGNFNTVVNVKEKGEIGSMVNALKAIPDVLKQIIAAYTSLEKEVESGNLGVQGDPSKFSGEFSSLIQGTNNILSRFRTTIDIIPSPVVMLDTNLRGVYLNTIARELAGNDYKGKTCGELFAREDYGTPTDALQRAAQTLQPASGETRAHPKGKALDVTYNSIPLLDGNGKLACVLQLLTDVTQIKSTQRTITDVASQALDISNRVAAASEQLSAQVEQVNRGTEVQRDRIGSTATAMEEMNATVLEVARSAGKASEQAEATRSKAQQGTELVNNVIGAIHQVNTVAVELQTNMQELGAQAESIGGVMNVISDIADQTNLLALNAAIEAARAGEAGRGFAVVADEVRKLAEKTMSATTEVGSSIRGIQSSTANNITRVGKAATSVQEATELAGTSGTALQEILHLADNNSTLISGIATAAEEQSATSEEINRAIEEVNRIAAETSSGMMQSSSAVQELSHMAQELKALLDRLRA